MDGRALKIIALAAMVCDHTAMALVEPLGQGSQAVQAASASQMTAASGAILTAAASQAAQMPASAELLSVGWLTVYVLLRVAGGLAFPIFAFLLVEGFLHTRDRKRYLAKLCVFALISEIPFDLALFGTSFYRGYQNVFFKMCIRDSPSPARSPDLRLLKHADRWSAPLLRVIGKGADSCV